ncbi:MAG: acyl-CoA thioester hydrolase [Gammaproteobacteria bacterium]|jgi:acyl-CoA thioester hydrolase
MSQPTNHQKNQYRYFLPIQTRWMDNDCYGHINNVIYYAYFDTISNHYLIKEAGFDIHRDETIGYIVNSNCQYLKSLSFPEALEGGFRVNRIGNSSVEYGIAIFREGEKEPSAHGTFTHVFVNRQSQTSAPIPPNIRSALERVLI